MGSIYLRFSSLLLNTIELSITSVLTFLLSNRTTHRNRLRERFIKM